MSMQPLIRYFQVYEWGITIGFVKNIFLWILRVYFCIIGTVSTVSLNIYDISKVFVGLINSIL